MSRAIAWLARRPSVVAMLLFVAAVAVVSAQWSYQVLVPQVTGTPNGIFSVPSPATCSDGTHTLPDGGYLKGGGSFTTDTTSTNDGYCQNYLYGSPYNVSPHGIVYIYSYEYVPDYPYPLGPTIFWTAQWPYAYPLEYDTRSPTGGGSGSYTNQIGSAPGVYRFTFQSTNETTGCNFPQYSAEASKTINVVSCLPKWKLDGGNLDRFPTDGTDITVGYPSSLDSVVRPAIEAWNTQLSALGLTAPHFVPAPSTSCAANDPHCVSVDVQTSGDDPTACGWRYTPPAPNGVYTYSSKVYLKPGYNNWSTDAQKATVAHEFGHLLGLDNQGTDCADSASVMRTPVTCGGLATMPTVSDALAIVKTVYQSSPRTTCG